MICIKIDDKDLNNVAHAYDIGNVSCNQGIWNISLGSKLQFSSTQLFMESNFAADRLSGKFKVTLQDEELHVDVELEP